MTKDEHVALLKTAIVANLTARIEHDKRQRQVAERRGEPPEFKVWDAADLLAADPNQLELDSIIKDPVRRALGEQLKDLGQRLYDVLGSVRSMSEMAWELADHTPHAGLAFTLMDKGWDRSAPDLPSAWLPIGADSNSNSSRSGRTGRAMGVTP